MNELKKKCWREKATAEITVTHVQEFAQQLGAKLGAAEVAQMLNHSGMAQDAWTRMRPCRNRAGRVRRPS